MKAVAIVVAGGSGSRMGSETPKQFLSIAGKPLLAHTLERVRACARVERTILVLPKEGFEAAKRLMAPYLDGSGIEVRAGGETRQESVREGLRAVDPGYRGLVAVHDGARPAVPTALIARVIEAASEHGGAIAAVPVTETLKEASDDGFVRRTLAREHVFRAQTPQCFRAELLREAFDRAEEDGFSGTDEAALVERIGAPIRIVPGDERNLKVTDPEDLARAEYYLGKEE